MIKRRTRLAIAVVIVGGAAALAAIVVHTLLPGSVIASVDVGPGPGYAPVSLAVDAGTGVVYVGRQDGGVTLLSTRTGRALRTLPSSTSRPGAVSVAIAEGLGRVYLAHGYSWAGIPGNQLDILDARRQTLLYRRRVRNLAGYMVVDEPLNTLFVATQTGISRLDARTGRLLGWTWSSGPNGVVVDRRTQRVFVPVGGPGSVSMLDAHTGRVLRTVRISAEPHHIMLDERIGRVYVLSDDTTLSVIDTRTGALLATRTLRHVTGGFVGYGLGVDTPADRVIVCEGDRAHVLDARRVREVTTVDLGSGPFSGNCDVAVDEAVHVAYISSPSGLHAIDTRTGAVLSSQGAMALRGGQVAVDRVSHHVFVGGPHYGGGTALTIASSLVNQALYPLVHRQFWVPRSGAATWAVSTVRGTR
ncbi:MAG TPA: PQQ-binding-like beta-propeller repeat protein [Chloroflexota bacterium]|nr:PQQ-binding-like beta-propeller repeat protein [Chloroflexota bacterium]